MSKSVHMCQSYSKPKAGRFLRHGVHKFTVPFGIFYVASVSCFTGFRLCFNNII